MDAETLFTIGSAVVFVGGWLVLLAVAVGQKLRLAREVQAWRQRQETHHGL